MVTQEQIDKFVKHLEDAKLVGLCINNVDCDANRELCKVNYTIGSKYIHIIVGHSSQFMIVKATGIIHPTKAWLQIHKGYLYGTIDTFDKYEWSGPGAPVRVK